MLDVLLGGKESKDAYPYLLDEEVSGVRKAYDDFFTALKTKETEKGTALYSRTSTKLWPKDFPKLFAHTSVGKVQNHPDFDAAKAGDEQAAMRLVHDLVKQDRLKTLAEKHPDAVVVGVVEQEPTGNNMIPRALASEMSKYGLNVDDNIGSLSKVSRRGLNAVGRLLARKVFDGKVIKGQAYIIADDVATQGGTFQELRHYIENKGGHVVGATSLAFSAGSNIIAIRKVTVSEIVKKFGRDNLEKLLYEENIAGTIEALTESEAKAILKFGTLDRLRVRINDERRKQGIAHNDEGQRTSNSLSSKLFGREATGLSVEDTEKSLIKEFGASMKRAIANGKVVIHRTAMNAPEGVKRMVAYHGSPHDHNKFSNEHIGTGEGAQAYGYGLYFAGAKDVAE